MCIPQMCILQMSIPQGYPVQTQASQAYSCKACKEAREILAARLYAIRSMRQAPQPLAHVQVHAFRRQGLCHSAS